LDLGITVYPPRDKGGRWRAAWHEAGGRQQCESVSEGKLAAKLGKVRQRLAMGASSMTRPARRGDATRLSRLTAPIPFVHLPVSLAGPRSIRQYWCALAVPGLPASRV
ncbi:MAG TPA: hypothetical protein VHT26_13835, partial [Trebonia sp.]|nr:hypothetical protein [Trebonia sp.]